MTKTDVNIARPEGYSTVEKMISWARLGWMHFGLLAFVILAIMSVQSLSAGMDELARSKLDSGLGLKHKEMRFYWDRWTKDFGSYMAVIPLGLMGPVVDRFGRFIPLFVTLILCGASIPLLWLTKDPTVFVFSYVFAIYWCVPSIIALSYLYCYELIPLKHRLVAQLAMSVAETLGMLLFGLTDKMALQSHEDENGSVIAELWAIRERFYSVVPLAFVGLALLVGVLVVRGRDTILSYVNCRTGETGSAFEALLATGQANTSEPVPFSREEFMINTERERFVMPDFYTTIKQISLGPLLALLSGPLVLVMWNESFDAYGYQVSDYLGGGYAVNALPYMLLEHGLAIAGIAVAIALWFWTKDVRFVPSVAVFIFSLGAVITASITIFDKDGYAEAAPEDQMQRLTTGVSLMLLARPVIAALYRVLTMDVFPTSDRGKGVFALKALEFLIGGLVATCTFKCNSSRLLFPIEATIVAAAGAASIAVFYSTNWFDKSLVCRDPELDACWLINPDSKVAVMGSRDRSSNTCSA